MGENTLLPLLLMLQLSSFRFFNEPFFFSFESLHFSKFSIAELFKLFLLFFHNSKFFFFEHFHTTLLKGFSKKYLQDRFNFIIEIEEITIPNLSFLIKSVLLWHKQSWIRSVNEHFCLGIFLILGWLICQGLNKFVSLNFDILSPRNRFRCAWFKCISLIFNLLLLNLNCLLGGLARFPKCGSFDFSVF